MAGTALLLVAGATGDAYAAWVMTSHGEADALAVLGAWLQSWYWFALLTLAFVGLPLLFPDGRLPSRRWRPAALVAVLGPVGFVLTGMVTGTLTGPARPPRFPALTDREREILALIAQGHPNPSIARRLSLSPKTVANYVSAIFAKRQVADRAEAMIRAREAGLG